MSTGWKEAGLSRRELFVALALVLCSFALIWNYRALYHQATDSLGYLYRIRTGQSSFHPHHLIYIPVVELLHRLVRQLCSSCDAMVAAQIHNTLWSSLVVGVTFVSARVLHRSTGAALATALFIGFTQGLIFYAWHAESFSAGLFWLTAMAGLLVFRPPDESSDRWLVPLAVCWVAAILYHQSNVLIGIPLVAVLLLTSSRHRIRRASRFLGAAGAVTLLTYFTVFVIDAGRFGLASFSRFMTRYGHSVRTDWGSLEYFSFDGLLEMLESQTWVLINVPGRFEEPAARVLGLLLLAIAGWHLHQLRAGGPRPEIRIFLLGWLAVYLLFFLWWLPREEDFFVATLTPIVWLGFWAGREGLAALDRTRSVSRLARLTGFSLLGAFVAWESVAVLGTYRATKSGDYVQAAAFAASFPEPCLLLGDSGVGSNLRYHFGRPRGLIVRNVPLMIADDASFPADRGSRYRLSETECLVVEAKRLLPGYQPLPGFDGRSRREVWLRYLEWVFDLELGEDGSVEHRRIRAVTAGEELYLQLGPGRDRSASSDRFFRRLDEQLAGGAPNPEDGFEAWWSEGEESLRDGPER